MVARLPSDSRGSILPLLTFPFCRAAVTATAPASTLTQDAASNDSAVEDFAWIPQAHAIVADLFRRSPAIYWADLLLSAGAAWALTAVYFTATPWSLVQIAAFLGASILFFRAGTFIHEIVHIPRGQMPWFGRVWNLLLGIPLLMPWVMYRNHVEHHSPKRFGTPADGEYLPLASSPLAETIKYLVQAPLLPLFMIVRFGVLGPLSHLNHRFREWVLRAASAAVSNPYYRKRFPTWDERHLTIVETLCFIYLAAIGALMFTHRISLSQLFMGYALLAWTLSLNWVRNLAAHRYANRGEPLSRSQQVADSINITGQTWLTTLMFPVGLRYHALHHLFPSMPYHNLGTAHRRLMQQLPPGTPYQASNCPNFFVATRDLLRSAQLTPPTASAMRAWRPESNHS